MMDRFRALIAKLEGNPKYATVLQFIKFGIVGVGNTLISLGVYWLCFYVFHWHYQVSNVVSFVVSVVNAYYWNSRFVFKTGADYTFMQHVKAFFKAFVSYGSTFLLNTVLLTVWVEMCGIDAGIAPLINLLITIPLNFLLNKFWAFRHHKQAPADAPAEENAKP